MSITVNIHDGSEFLEIDDYFFSLKYYNYQKSFFKLGLYLVVRKSERPIGFISFFSNDGKVWLSPGKGTYGGLFLIENVYLKELSEIYKFIIDIIKSEGGEILEITLPPENHNSSINSRHSWVLWSLGSVLERSDLNHFISVDSNPLETKLNYGNKKRLKKCDNAGCHFQRVKIENLSDIYDLLEKNRALKKNRLSLSKNQLENLLELFPESIEMFRLLLPPNNVMISAAVCIRISKKILYVFYWGNDPDYSNFSPVVPLACGIYSYCVSQGIETLDLGVSTLNKDGNFGLVRFKDSLGASVSRKDKIRLDLLQ